MERRSSDQIFDSILREEIRRLNQHLPRQRVLLSDLLKEDSPRVSSFDGRIIEMKKEELEKLAALTSQEVAEKLRLPIVLIRRNDLGAGAFTVLSGDKIEMYAVSRMLGIVNGTFENYRRESPQELIVYKPEVSELIRNFHSLIVVGFGVTEGL